jgi:hypothetical protein
MLVLTNLFGFTIQRLGKLTYLLSVMLLYSLFLLALRQQWAGLVVVLAVAGSLFHAVEYLAIVSHYAMRRQRIGSDGLFRQLARNWVLYLVLYLVVLGSIASFMVGTTGWLHQAWLGVNVWMAFVHYAFDGMIWKLRRADTAAVIGAAP